MDARLARRLALVALLSGIAADALFDRVGLGINVPVTIVVALTVSTLFRPAGASIDRLDLWMPPVAVLAAATLALRSDPALILLDGLVAGLATLGWAIAVSGQALTRRSVLAVASLGFLAVAYVAIGSAKVVAAAASDGALGEARRSGRQAVPVVRGLLIALPVVAVFTALLASADTVFARLVDEVVTVPIDLSDLATRITITLGAAWLIGGGLAIASAVVPMRVEDLGFGELVDAGVATGIRLRGSTEALVVLVAVDLLFAVFVVLQVAYLFGGQEAIESTGITYSDYAREGYFQLVAVVAGAGTLLAIAELAARRPEGRSRPFVAAALGLLGLTAVILASAAVRLGLYQQIYGWTELRFYVAASIGWLAICGAVATVLVVRDRMAWLFHGLAFGAIAVLLVVSAIGPQAFVTQMNVARALDPSLVPAAGHSGLDADYLATLGDDAVPQLVAALPRLDPASRSALVGALERRRAELDTDPATSPWQAWNLARERARAALEQLPSLAPE
jgi:hypothetical protein